ncbi:LysM peptidoglycan-binding domain-containing protein [Amycolatopsis sacchari]|uniref:LysM peptidoglycan-binding domain-containing protein n=1 Tax=Amycolatopsis sacchari TaxID=115433 RepID=UPI003D74E013
MAVLLDGSRIAGAPAEGRTRQEGPVRVRRHAGEMRRPPTRARVVAGRGRAAVPGCAPRRVSPRWPWLAGVAVAVALVVTGLGVFAQGMSHPVPSQTATVTVGEGQTLWDVAHEYAPASDADAVVAKIRELNGLGDAALVPGLPLTVPVDAAPVGASR